jgi:hypothetical protein
LSQNRCLALAPLIFVSLSCVRAVRAQAEDLPPSPPTVSLPAAHSTTTVAVVDPAENLPDDPSATHDPGSADIPQQAAQPGQSQPGQSTSAGDPSTRATQDADRQKAEDQLKEQEHHRVMGVMAAFNTTINRDALPLSPGQKFQLFFKSQADPWPFALTAVVAGIGQAQNDHQSYGQGVQGYAKRYGADYTDAFIGNFFGNAVLTSWWHEDPRYFQKGTGSITGRALWAATSTVWCKRDNGSWGPNYANVIGNLIGAAIANVYYPAGERTAADTITRGLTVSAEGIVGSELIEFWPDIARHYTKNRAAKAAQKAAQQDAQSASGQSTPTQQPAGAPKP